MTEIQKKIDNILGEIGKDYQWLLGLINKYIEHKKKRAGSFRRYYLKNKHKLDKYHEEYRETHPEYRNKAKERARRSRK